MNDRKFFVLFTCCTSILTYTCIWLR